MLSHVQLIATHRPQPTRSLCPGDFPGPVHWSGLPFPPLRILLSWQSNSCLLPLLKWQVDSLPLRFLGSPMYTHTTHAYIIYSLTYLHVSHWKAWSQCSLLGVTCSFFHICYFFTSSVHCLYISLCTTEMFARVLYFKLVAIYESRVTQPLIWKILVINRIYIFYIYIEYSSLKSQLKILSNIDDIPIPINCTL